MCEQIYYETMITWRPQTFFAYIAKTDGKQNFYANRMRLCRWLKLCRWLSRFIRIQKNHPQSGRPAYEFEVMLRIYFLQNRFGDLSAPEPEETFHSLFFEFTETDQQKSIPDETAICKFRHPPEKHQLNERIFEKLIIFLKRKNDCCVKEQLSIPRSFPRRVRLKMPRENAIQRWVQRKKQSPASRHEIAYRSGCSIQGNSFISLYVGECARYYLCQSMITLHWRRCFCWFRIYLNWETSENKKRSILACYVKNFEAQKNATTRSHWRTDWTARKDNHINSSQGRASVSNYKMPVRFCKNKISWLQEEREQSLFGT